MLTTKSTLAALAIVATLLASLPACGGDDGDGGGGADGGSGGTATTSTADGGMGTGGTATGGEGGGMCTGNGELMFADSCECDDQCDSGLCFAFGMGSRCTIPCPADPMDCPNMGEGCNNMDPAVCKTGG